MDRALIDCFNAVYPNLITHDYVWCKKGHKLGDGRITGEHVQIGRPLVCQICQTCWDFTYMGEWEGEKGWSVDTYGKPLLTNLTKSGSI